MLVTAMDINMTIINYNAGNGDGYNCDIINNNAGNGDGYKHDNNKLQCW